MPHDKLTLSADDRVIRLAKRLARREGTSVSAMFARLIEQMDRIERSGAGELAPLTREALGLARSRSSKSDRDLITDALLERYGA